MSIRPDTYDGFASSVGDLEELRQPVLRSMSCACLAVSWLWWLVAWPGGRHPLSFWVLLPTALPTVAAVTALAWRGRATRWVSVFMIIAIESAFLSACLLGGGANWLYYQSLVVIAASLLVGPRVAFVFAVLCTAASVVGTDIAAVAVDDDLIAVVGLIWATAATSWLVSRSLYTVLDWSLSSQAQTRQSLNEVQRRREQLRSTLDSLRRAHDALERTTRDLQAATLEAEEARRAKSRFVASISHELRTPLNIIVGFAELLVTSPASYGDFAWPQALLGDLLTIWRNAEHLLKMIDDILDLAQIEASHFPLLPEATDLNSLIEDALGAFSSLVERSGLELRRNLAPDLPMLNLDGTRVRQVVLNLLNNAVRYTASGYIEIGTEAREQDVLVYVRDTGRGIAADRLGTIFEEFERAETTISRSQGGAGLGLAISRQFIRLHGGHIWAESALGEGSTFYFTLPRTTAGVAVQPAHPRRPWAAAASSADEVRPVLVLCQDAAVVRTIERHLVGRRTMPVPTVEEAIHYVNEWHPDALLIAADAGSDLAQEAAEARAVLQAVAPFDLPVLVSSFPTERRASQALQVADFLLKPVSRHELVAAVGRVCQNPRRALVVDDEPDMLRLITRLLREEWPGCDTVTAASAEEAMDLLSPRPSVILLDLLMPGMNGLEFLAWLRADPSLAHIATIVVTARGPAEDIARAGRGELRLLRGASFSAGDITRLAVTIADALPPRYGFRPASGQELPATAPAARA